MADSEIEQPTRTSFVNENFDDLESASSKDSLPQKEATIKEGGVASEDATTDNLEFFDITREGVANKASMELSGEVPTLEVTPTPDDGYNPFVQSSPSPTPVLSDNRSRPLSSSPVYDEIGSNCDTSGGNLLRPSSDRPLHDLQVNITTHEKHHLTKNDVYITYKIETKSLRPRHLFEQDNYIVWRRYRDFDWLHDQLERNHPTLILPPLPGKQIMRYLDHMSEAFVEERQRCLDQFLWRVATHPFFSYDHNFKMFLTANNEAFTKHVADSASGSSLLGKMSISMKQATTAIRLKHPDAHYSTAGKYMNDLSDKMGVLERIESRLQTERTSLAASSEDLSAVVYTWANSETLLGNPIRKLAGIFEANAASLTSLNETNAYSFLLAMKMYQLYANSGVSAIKRRDMLQLSYETNSEERDKKRKQHEEAVRAGKNDKVVKLAAELEKVGVITEASQDKLAQSNEQLRVDIEKWMEAKDKELTDILLNWADNQLRYHERTLTESYEAMVNGTAQMFHEWEELLLVLQQIGHTDVTTVDQSESSISNNHDYEAIF